MTTSLSIEVEHDEGVSADVQWSATAPWLDLPIFGASFFDVYWAAMRARVTP